MFDPRTLPNGDLWPNLGLFVAYAGMALDTAAAYYGASQFNPPKATKTLWFGPVSTTWAFINGGLIRGAAICALAALLPHVVSFDNAHAYVEWLLAIPGFASLVHNLIIIKK